MVKIYSTSWCQPCAMAKKLLNQKNIEYEEIDIEKIGMSRDELNELTGGSTVPQIIIDGKSSVGFLCKVKECLEDPIPHLMENNIKKALEL